MNGPPERENPGTAARATSATPIAAPDVTPAASQQVSWFSVHTFVVAAVLNQVNGWPMLGTPAWCALACDDPRKWAALLDGAQHWALRVETCQEAHADASRSISGAVDWAALGREINRRTDFYAARPYLRRRSR